jgi:hypothetical protein
VPFEFTAEDNDAFDAAEADSSLVELHKKRTRANKSRHVRPSMSLRVCFLTPGRKYSLDVVVPSDPNTTVAVVNRCIELQHGIPLCSQALASAGQILHPSQTLLELGLSGGSAVVLVIQDACVDGVVFSIRSVFRDLKSGTGNPVFRGIILPREAAAQSPQ